MVFLTYRSPMPPAPWAIPTASECANDDARPRRAKPPRQDDTRAMMEAIFGPATPREKAGMARIELGLRTDA